MFGNSEDLKTIMNSNYKTSEKISIWNFYNNATDSKVYFQVVVDGKKLLNPMAAVDPKHFGAIEGDTKLLGKHTLTVEAWWNKPYSDDQQPDFIYTEAYKISKDSSGVVQFEKNKNVLNISPDNYTISSEFITQDSGKSLSATISLNKK